MADGEESLRDALRVGDAYRARDEDAARFQEAVDLRQNGPGLLEQMQDAETEHRVVALIRGGPVLDRRDLEHHVSHILRLRLVLRDADHPLREVDCVDPGHVGGVGQGGRSGPAAEFQHVHVRAKVGPGDVQLLLIGRLVGDGLAGIALRDPIPETGGCGHFNLL